MITDILLYIFAGIINLIVTFLPTWTVWPDQLLNGLTYFFTNLAKLNFIFPVDSLFSVMLFVLSFEMLYFGTKLVMKFFNYLRGTGSGLDL